LAARRPAPSPDALVRAVRLSRLPGVTLAEASERAGVPVTALRRGRQDGTIVPTRDDLLLGALTRNGADTEGTVGDLANLASWLDYVNHDGTTADEVGRDLERLATAGTITVADGRFRLLVRWP